MHQWMDGWVDGWTDKWMDTHGPMEGRMDGCMDRQIVGWMNAWVDGWMDGWMDGQSYQYRAADWIPRADHQPCSCQKRKELQLSCRVQFPASKPELSFFQLLTH